MRIELNFWLRNLLCVAGATLFSLNAVAQEEEDAPPSTVENKAMTIIADSSSGGAPIMISSMSSSVDGQPPTFSFVTPGTMGGDFVMGSTFGGGEPTDPLNLIHNPDIQKEIDLDQQQLDDYKKLNGDFQQRLQELTLGMRDGKFDREQFREVGSTIKKLRDEQTARVKEILLPHQFDRLEQISTQQFLQNAGAANALASKALMEKLGLSDEQVQRLKNRSEEVAKELKEKMEALQAEAKDKILSELTTEQREKLEQMTGKQYKFKMPEAPRFGPGMRQRIETRRNDKN
jgi:hypothetical protein